MAVQKLKSDILIGFTKMYHGWYKDVNRFDFFE